MTAQSTDLEDNGLVLPEEDGLFARDIDGQLVRMDKVTAADFEKQITIKIDGREVTVPKAVPQTDSQGKILRDAEGRPVPRATTIYDAATKAYAGDPAGHPIPVLCHQEHLDPVGVRRVIDRCLKVEGDALLFAHGHVLRVLAATWLRLAPEDGERFTLSTASVSILGFEHENRVIRQWNSV